HEEDERPRGEADADRRRSADPDAVLEELEADRADQRARAECKHEPDQPVRPRPCETEQRTEHERRRGDHTPAERCAHQGLPASGAWVASHADTAASTALVFLREWLPGTVTTV